MLKQAVAASPTSGPAWSALFIAVAGIVLSLASLGWQVLVFARTGSRIRVEMKFGTFLSQGPVGLLASEIIRTMQNNPNIAQSDQPIYLPKEFVTALAPGNLKHSKE